MSNDSCVSCAFYLGAGRCMAYEKIPDKILLSEVEHNQILDGQEGDFIYTPRDKAAEENFFKAE